MRPFDLGRIDVCQGDEGQRPVGFEDVDGAPVRQIGHREPSDALDGRLPVQRSTELLGRGGQERLRPLPRPVLRDIHEDVHHMMDLAACVEERRRANERPPVSATGASPEANDRLWFPFPGKGSASRQLTNREWMTVLIQDLESADDLFGRGSLHIFSRSESRHPGRRIVGVDERSGRVLDGDSIRAATGDDLQDVPAGSSPAIPRQPEICLDLPHGAHSSSLMAIRQPGQWLVVPSSEFRDAVPHATVSRRRRAGSDRWVWGVDRSGRPWWWRRATCHR